MFPLHEATKASNTRVDLSVNYSDDSQGGGCLGIICPPTLIHIAVPQDPKGK